LLVPHLTSRSKQGIEIGVFDLERALTHFSGADAWTIRDACEGCQIFGVTGSGKTSGSGAALARAFLRAGFGGLALTAKPDERELGSATALRPADSTTFASSRPGIVLFP